MILTEKYTLSNGVEIPKLGLGTWEIPDNKVTRAVRDAVEIGYRHIDTAQGYGNEHGTGEGIRNCGIERENIFLTTKMDAAIKTYAGAVTGIESSLKSLGLDHIDLMIIHSPKPWSKFHSKDRYQEGNRAVWKALEEGYKAGKIRAIGISNFEKEDIENILGACSVKPMVNQILTHISNTPLELIAFCQKSEILVEAYSPIAHGELLKNKQVSEIAKKYNASVPQLGIRFCLQLGLLPLPKTTDPTHMKSNSEVDFIISEADMDYLKNIERIKDYGEFSKFPVFGGRI
jgi:diketogulonate reductase-like aldo/keto reductase